MITTLLLLGTALAQDVPPELGYKPPAEEFSRFELTLSTSHLGIGLQTQPANPRVSAVGIRGGIGPALNLSLSEEDFSDAFLGTSVALYTRLAWKRVELEGGVGPALLAGQGLHPALMSEFALMFNVRPRLAIRVGGMGYVGLYGQVTNELPSPIGQQIAFAPDLGVGLRF